MATSEVQICNLALIRVGHRQLIDDLDEATTEAQLCKAMYELARDAVLERHWWKFATRRSTLGLLANVSRSGWVHAYAVPVDCLTERYLYPGTRNPANEQRIPFDVEDDSGVGRILLTDQEDAELVYTARVENPVLFSSGFVQALTWKLASDLALGLPVKPQVGLAMANGYERALAVAAASDANRQQRDRPPEAEHIRVR